MSKKETQTKPVTASKGFGGVFGMLEDIKGITTSPTTAPIDDIVADAAQHREVFDEAELENLAESIREVGIINPIVVSPTGGTPPWKIVDGERRWRAARMTGLSEVRISVRDDMTDSKNTPDGKNTRHLVQLVANTNKSDLRDYEIAKAIQRQLDEWGNKRGDAGRLAKLINRPASAISRYLAMLDPKFESLVKEGVVRNAEVLARFKALAPELQEKLADAARSTGEPVTDAQVRDAARAAAAEANAALTPAPAVDATVAGSAAAETPAPPSDHGSKDLPGPTAGDSSPVATTHVDGVAATGVNAPAGDSISSSEDGTRSHVNQGHDDGQDDNEAAPGSSDGHDADLDDDGHDADLDDDGQDDDDDGQDGTLGGEHRGAVGKPAGGTTRAAGQREKAVSVQLTGERIELLVRYLVDKASDRLEVRVPHDLAIAVIENLGGELPSNRDSFGEVIRDLIDAKFVD